MSPGRSVACLRVRRALQEYLDGTPRHRLENRLGFEQNEPHSRGARFVSEHLSSCPECAAFARSLEGLGAGLRKALNSRLASLPPPRIDEALLREAARRQHAQEERRREHRSAWSRGVRWAAFPVAAAIIAAVLGPILTRQAETGRLIRQEITVFVDQLYAEPLLEGVESALYAGPDDLELLDKARGDIARWLGSGEPSRAGFD